MKHLLLSLLFSLHSLPALGEAMYTDAELTEHLEKLAKANKSGFMARFAGRSIDTALSNFKPSVCASSLERSLDQIAKSMSGKDPTQAQIQSIKETLENMGTFFNTIEQYGTTYLDRSQGNRDRLQVAKDGVAKCVILAAKDSNPRILDFLAQALQ